MLGEGPVDLAILEPQQGMPGSKATLMPGCNLATPSPTPTTSLQSQHVLPVRSGSAATKLQTIAIPLESNPGLCWEGFSTHFHIPVISGYLQTRSIFVCAEANCHFIVCVHLQFPLLQFAIHFCCQAQWAVEKHVSFIEARLNSATWMGLSPSIMGHRRTHPALKIIWHL